MEGMTMLDKWKANAPYYLFYNMIPESSDTFNQKNSIEFTDLLCKSLGKLKCTLQLASVINVKWIMEQYQKKNIDSLPCTIIYKSLVDENEKEFVEEHFKQITLHQMDSEAATHHSKIGLFVYDDDSLRIVVFTGKMWAEKTRYNVGLWLSPPCPLSTDYTKNNGESPTGFKSDLLNYLSSYKIPCLKPWIQRVEKADFSDVRVFLVTSVPGSHFANSRGCHRFSVANLLQKHCRLPNATCVLDQKKWKVIAQASNLGKLGDTWEEWVQPVIQCLSKCKSNPLIRSADFSFVYPTEDNVTNGYFGPDPLFNKYHKETDDGQRWFRVYMHQWKADGLNRSRAMPSIKSYTRVSPCLTKMAYYLLTSANLTKSAWGSRVHRNKSVYVRAYEAGVLFLPEFFGEEYFEIKESPTNRNSSVFPIMYDLPLTPYGSNDKPWSI